MATVDARGYVYITVAHGLFAVHDVLGLHIGVGFCVARSDYIGQCEGLRVSGRATGTDSRAFSVCNNPLFFKPTGPGSLPAKTKKAMKTIIAIKESAEKGKTHAVKEAAKRFPFQSVEYFDYNGNNIPQNEKGEIICRGTINVNGNEKTIGFSSEGDYRSVVDNALKVITCGETIEVDVIVTDSRTRGGSVDAINDFAAKHGYDVIWTSLYHGVNINGEKSLLLSNGFNLNIAFAENMETLIKNLLS